MDGSAIDSQLIEITGGPPPSTIANVLTLTRPSRNQTKFSVAHLI